MSPTGSDDTGAAVRGQDSSSSAVPRRGRIGVVDEDEEKVAYVVADNEDAFSAGVNDVGVKKGDTEKNEVLQLMRGLMGRLDRLEESQSKINGQFSGGARANRIVGAAPMPHVPGG
uniref:AlNc14C17G1791 protein n=1 Tax=Albugo laibachii Nc14 TaxID=890382 RepID=F0W4C0_9STRA|nr:AlNc14C17G1791 [Albugo laibachii Nc14]|eukprot:CCA15953.1 AlNc14C17G1791 [Albugo laibachii Nc14]